MSTAGHEGSRAVLGAKWFATTHWSVVLAASQQDSPASSNALAKLCSTYWYPLYAYVRRRGHDAHQAQDLTQEFFARLLQRNFLQNVAPDKGRFRSFMLASLKNFLANEWDRAQTQKRCGGVAPIPFEQISAESRYQLEPIDSATPEILYERRWR